MDKAYVKEVLSKLERMKAVHDEKFSDNPHHKDCQKRLDKTIDNLREEMKEQSESEQRFDFSVSESALPDAIEPAARLQAQANQLELDDPMAIALREQSRDILFKELNELDGFDR
jgi:hypothetical protein